MPKTTHVSAARQIAQELGQPVHSRGTARLAVAINKETNVSNESKQVCPECEGKGEVYDGETQDMVPCRACSGRASVATESKHTPGPWAFFDNDTDERVDGEQTDRRVSLRTTWEKTDQYGAKLPEFVAWLEQGIDNPADARLIAAAPDLLEACKKALVQFDYMLELMGDDLGDEFYTGAGPECKTRADELRAAIAKAQGGGK